jgi:hypothetical protein
LSGTLQSRNSYGSNSFGSGTGECAWLCKRRHMTCGAKRIMNNVHIMTNMKASPERITEILH